MTREYKVTQHPNHKVISYEENGFHISFMDDPANSDYQRYLAWLENPEAEQSTPNLGGNE
jgi:hypothetical protein